MSKRPPRWAAPFKRWATSLADRPHQNATGLLAELCQRFVSLDEATRTTPNAMSKRNTRRFINGTCSVCSGHTGSIVTRSPCASPATCWKSAASGSLWPGRGAQERRVLPAARDPSMPTVRRQRRGEIHLSQHSDGLYFNRWRRHFYQWSTAAEFHHPREALPMPASPSCSRS